MGETNLDEVIIRRIAISSGARPAIAMRPTAKTTVAICRLSVRSAPVNLTAAVVNKAVKSWPAGRTAPTSCGRENGNKILINRVVGLIAN